MIWQLIGTAPRDGTIIDLWVTDNAYPNGYRSVNCFWSETPSNLPGGDGKTGWMQEVDGFHASIDCDGLVVTHWLKVKGPDE
jgi:hypothetical protein